MTQTRNDYRGPVRRSNGDLHDINISLRRIADGLDELLEYIAAGVEEEEPEEVEEEETNEESENS